MGDKKEFLTEEKYEAANKKIKKVSLIILIVGIVAGLSLIIAGFVKANSHETAEEIETKISNLESVQEKLEQEVEDTKKTVGAEYDSSINELESEKTALTREKNKTSYRSDEYYAKEDAITAKEREISTKQSEKSEAIAKAIKEKEAQIKDIEESIVKLDSEKWRAENGLYFMESSPFFAIGGMLIFIGVLYSLMTWFITKRRAIMAYTAQSARPIIEEGTEKVAPTVAKASGKVTESVAEGVAKGIKKGREK